MLTHNALDFTRQCVDSLLQHTTGRWELICVDNGSSDGTVDYLNRLADTHAHVRVIANGENLGFAAGNNRGLAAAAGEQVVLINSDIVVTAGWLDRLLACADQSGKIGLVGPMTNNISGPQQLPSVGYDPTNLTGLAEFAASHALRTEGVAKPYWRAVGFCLLIKREVIETIGGLDERFGLGNFEDDDYCLRALLTGWQTWLAADCFVHHYGSQSFAAAGVDYRQCLQDNWEIFKQKWGVPAAVAYGASYDFTPHLKRGLPPDLLRFPLPGRAVDVPSADRATCRATTQAADLWRRGRREEAVNQLAKYLKDNADDRDAAWNLGQYLHDLGLCDQAIRLFATYLGRHPQDAAIRETMAAWREAQASPSASRASPSLK